MGGQFFTYDHTEFQGLGISLLFYSLGHDPHPPECDQLNVLEGERCSLCYPHVFLLMFYCLEFGPRPYFIAKNFDVKLSSYVLG